MAATDPSSCRAKPSLLYLPPSLLHLQKGQSLSLFSAFESGNPEEGSASAARSLQPLQTDPASPPSTRLMIFSPLRRMVVSNVEGYGKSEGSRCSMSSKRRNREWIFTTSLYKIGTCLYAKWKLEQELYVSGSLFGLATEGRQHNGGSQLALRGCEHEYWM
ncbi:hypothetical protein LR48_Vigan08g106000 [Vigna angularis]|uniref:Uncharacterized protein n=1 Tax=Phaseolus angularis TaxID=3914 RepID=A0A0L9V5I2_PHAAN|nr:hypothetical protein LR48_Vigan08g106000 [Vigna angularis]